MMKRLSYMYEASLTEYSRVPNVGNFNPARFIGKVCHMGLFLCKKARGFQKFMLSLSETTASGSNLNFLLKNLIESCFWHSQCRFRGRQHAFLDSSSFFA